MSQLTEKVVGAEVSPAAIAGGEAVAEEGAVLSSVHVTVKVPVDVEDHSGVENEAEKVWKATDDDLLGPSDAAEKQRKPNRSRSGLRKSYSATVMQEAPTRARSKPKLTKSATLTEYVYRSICI